MLVMKLSGGLGNQLNHYFFSQFLSEFYDDEVLYNDELIKKDWQCINYLPFLGLKLNNARRLLHNKQCIYLKNNLDITDYNRGTTYIINNNYEHPFTLDMNLREKVNRIIFDISLLDKKNNDILSEILSVNSCGIHIRRGDYYNVKKTKDVFGILDIEYFHKSMELLKEKYSDIVFFIFSDEPEWVRQNMILNEKIILIDNNEARISGSFDNYKVVRVTKRILKPVYKKRLLKTLNDFYLLSNCRHFIISNSSFSWWAAYLGSGIDKTVVCPFKWNVRRTSESTTPHNWIKIN